MDKLFCDLKTDEEKAAFFLSGRGYETGVISQAIQNDVAMAYQRCAEYRKELEALQSRDKEDAGMAEIVREAAQIIAAIPPEHAPDNIRWPIVDELEGFASKIDHARRVEGGGE